MSAVTFPVIEGLHKICRQNLDHKSNFPTRISYSYFDNLMTFYGKSYNIKVAYKTVKLPKSKHNILVGKLLFWSESYIKFLCQALITEN